MLPSILSACFAVLLSIAAAAAPAQKPDLAAEFARLQSQVFESRTRIAADIEQERLERAAPSRPTFVQDQYCPRPVPPSVWPPWNVIVQPDDRTARAQALLDEMVAGIMTANGLSIPNLCPVAIEDSAEFGAYSNESPPLEVESGRRLSIIVVTVGLLSRLENDSQLAAGLGHELTHLMLLHMRERREREAASDSIARGYPSSRPAADYLRNWAIGDTVSQEAEADYVGLIYMHRAGYDPSVMPRFFELYRKYKPNADDVRGWMHPPVSYRAQAAIREAEQELKGAPVAARPILHLSEIQRLLAPEP